MAVRYSPTVSGRYWLEMPTYRTTTNKVKAVARQRVRQIEQDVVVLRDHYPDIFAELQTTVCDTDEQ